MLPIDINDSNKEEFEKAANLIGKRFKMRKINRNCKVKREKDK